MPRPKRFTPAGYPQHVTQRGNNKQAIFHQAQDFYVFRKYLKQQSEKYEVAIHAWVLMTNHFHLLCTPSTNTGLSQMMQFLNSRYSKFYNKAYSKTGTLWGGRFHASLIDSEHYLMRCHQYIELNPVRAGMCEYASDYLHSSHQHNAFGANCDITSPHPCYLAIDRDEEQRLKKYRDLFATALSPHELKTFRLSSKKNSRI